MPVWPKSFYTFGLSLKTAATEWKLRKKRAAVPQQERTLAPLLATLATTSFWREAGIEAGMSYDKFRARLPLHTYEQLAAPLERMARGDANVLWPGACALFAGSSGTTDGAPKHLPASEEMLSHFRRGTRDALLYYTVRAKHAGVFRGRHLLVGSSTTPSRLGDSPLHEAYAAELTGIIALTLPTWADRHLFEPGTAAAKLADWEPQMDAIIDRTCRCDISLVAGLPTWINVLARELRERCANSGQRIAHLQIVWPNLECLLHTGVPIGPYVDELRATLGPTVKFHEVYAAAEGFIAAQDCDGSAAGLRLMADLGLFFEFLPMTEFEPARLAQLGPKAVPLSGVKTNTDYALVLTTPAGLARYVLGDVVRFISLEPPRLVYVGRTALQLNAFGERVAEKEATDAIVSVCSRHRWTIVNFHVAPLFTPVLTGQPRGRHEWWLELKPGTVETPTGPQIAAAVDTELQRVNPDYTAKRRAGVLEAPFVRLVMPGIFEHWLRHHQRWGGQHKLGRCRSDRTIADELAGLTHFARD